MTQNIAIASAGTPSAIRQHYYSRKIKMYLFAVIIIALWMGFYGVQKYLDLHSKIVITSESEKIIKDIDSTMTTERQDNATSKESSAALFDMMGREISKIFPGSEDYTDLTRLLDNFFKENNLSKNPIVATDLQFNQPQKDEKDQYAILPFSISIESSEKNFYKFLSFIESSGSLNGKIRLMDIQSIQLNFPDEKDETRKTIRFSAKLRAYSAKITEQESTN